MRAITRKRNSQKKPTVRRLHIRTTSPNFTCFTLSPPAGKVQQIQKFGDLDKILIQLMTLLHKRLKLQVTYILVLYIILMHVFRYTYHLVLMIHCTGTVTSIGIRVQLHSSIRVSCLGCVTGPNKTTIKQPQHS